jgi:hypothetical protein
VELGTEEAGVAVLRAAARVEEAMEVVEMEVAERAVEGWEAAMEVVVGATVEAVTDRLGPGEAQGAPNEGDRQRPPRHVRLRRCRHPVGAYGQHVPVRARQASLPNRRP